MNQYLLTLAPFILLALACSKSSSCSSSNRLAYSAAVFDVKVPFTEDSDCDRCVARKTITRYSKKHAQKTYAVNEFRWHFPSFRFGDKQSVYMCATQQVTKLFFPTLLNSKYLNFR